MNTFIIEMGYILLLPFEKLSHCFQIATGYTCFTLSRACVCLTVGCMCDLLYWYVVHWEFTLVGMLALFIAFIPKAIFDESQELEESVTEGVKNPLIVNVNFVIGRTILLVASAVSIRSWSLGNSMASSAFALTFFALSLHFLSCTPLPPSPDEEEEREKELAIEGAKA